MIPARTGIACDPEARLEPVHHRKDGVLDSMIIAIASTVLQRPPRALERVLEGDVAGVAGVVLREPIDRVQLAHVVAATAWLGDLQADLAHVRVLQAPDRRLVRIERRRAEPDQLSQQHHTICERAHLMCP